LMIQHTTMLPSCYYFPPFFFSFLTFHFLFSFHFFFVFLSLKFDHFLQLRSRRMTGDHLQHLPHW
jgi:hypothetical protein